MKYTVKAEFIILCLILNAGLKLEKLWFQHGINKRIGVRKYVKSRVL